MRESGRVTQVGDNNVVVKMEPRAGCHACPLGRLCSGRDRHLTVQGFEGLNVGDLVEVEIPARGVTTAAFLVFLLPLVVSMAASWGTFSLTGKWGWGIAAFFGCLVFIEIIVALIDRRCGTRTAFQPTIIGKISVDPDDRWRERLRPVNWWPASSCADDCSGAPMRMKLPSSRPPRTPSPKPGRFARPRGNTS